VVNQQKKFLQFIHQHPRLILVISTFAVGPAAILTKIIIYNSALTIAFWRVLFAGIISLLLSNVLKEKSGVLPKRHKDRWLIIIAGVFLAFHFSLWFESLRYVSVALSVIVVTTTPIWMTLAALFFMKIFPTKNEKIAIFLVILSIIIMLFETGNNGALVINKNFVIGTILALVSSWFIVGYFFIAKRILSTQSLWGYFGLVNLSAAITLALLLLLKRESFLPLHFTDFGVLLIMALGPSLIGHAGYNYSMKLTRPHDVGFAILGEPIIASVLAFFIFKEVPALTTILGGILIFIAIYLVVVISEEEAPLI